MDPTIVLVLGVSLAVIQLLLLLRSIFHGARALARRQPNERSVVAPAIAGLVISLSTVALVAFLIALAAFRK